MNTEQIRRNTGDPPSRGGNDPTQAPRGDEAVRAGVGEVHNSEEPSNDRGAKGPQFQGNVTSGKRTHQSKAQTQYADHARAMARTFNKISVPQERGRFAQPALFPRATLLPLHLAGLRRGLASHQLTRPQA